MQCLGLNAGAAAAAAAASAAAFDVCVGSVHVQYCMHSNLALSALPPGCLLLIAASLVCCAVLCYVRLRLVVACAAGGQVHPRGRQVAG
jgi:hypothetical protein